MSTCNKVTSVQDISKCLLKYVSKYHCINRALGMKNAITDNMPVLLFVVFKIKVLLQFNFLVISLQLQCTCVLCNVSESNFLDLCASEMLLKNYKKQN